MGASRGNAQQTAQAVSAYRSTGGTVFSYNGKTVQTGSSLHPALDPAFGGKRYSLKPKDRSDKTLISASLIVDVTGSNAEAARKIMDDMPQIHGLWEYLIPEEFHPNLQIGAVDDYYGDNADGALQLSQFEADLSVMTKWLERLWPAGRGYGNGHEAYEAALWAAAYQNDLEIWKDGRKGILVIMFDELPYDRIYASRLRSLYRDKPIGTISNGEMSDKMQRSTVGELPKEAFRDMEIEELVAEVKKKYDVFGVLCSESDGYGSDFRDNCFARWSGLLGAERTIKMADASDMSELTTALIARTAGASKKQIMEALSNGNTATSNGLQVIDRALTLFGAGSIVTADQSHTLRRL